jgi:TP901 family phage tail tape measure protein
VGQLVVSLELAMDKFKRGVDDAKRQSADLGNRLSSDFNKSVNKINDGNRFEQLAGTARSAGMAMTVAGGAMAYGLGQAVKTSADFGANMSKVQALSGSSAEEFQQLREQALKLGADTSFSSGQAAEGMQMLAAAGFNANQIMDAMPGVLDAAAASGEEMGLVAETIGSALSTFGLKASESGHIADVLASAANSSAIGLQDMAYSMKYAGPVAAQLGYSVEEVGAALIEMGNAGIKGEQAGTTLRAALLNLVDPPKEAADTMAALGMKFTDSAGKMLPLGDVIGVLKQKTEGMTEAQKAATLAQLFGKEAASGMLVLLAQGPEAFKKYQDGLINSAGAAKTAAEIMKDNLQGSLEELGGSVEAALIHIGDALTPVIQTVAKGVTATVNVFNSMPGPLKTVIAVILATVAGILLIGGPLLMLIGFLPSIVAGFAALPAVLGLVAGGFASLWAAITGPIGLVIAAVAAVVLIVRQLIKHHDDIVAGLQSAWKWITQLWDKIKIAIGSALKAIADLFIQYHPIGIIISNWEEIGVYLGGVATRAWEWGKNIVLGLWEGIKAFVGNVIGTVADLATSIKNTIFGILGISSPSRVMRDAGYNIGEGLTEGMEGSANKVEGASAGLADRVMGTFRRLLKISSPSEVYDEFGQMITEGLARGIASGSEDPEREWMNTLTAQQDALAEHLANMEAMDAMATDQSYADATEAERLQNEEMTASLKASTQAAEQTGKAYRDASADLQTYTDNTARAASGTGNLKDAVLDLVDKTMNRLSQALSITEKEFKVLEYAMGKSATIMDKLGFKKQSLALQYNLLTREVNTLQSAYDQESADHGKYSDEALGVYEKLLDLKIRIAEVGDELTKSAEQENRMRRNISLLESGAAMANGATGAGMVVGGKGGSVVNINVNNYGTKGESAENATTRELQKLVYMGVFAQ